MKQIPLTQGKFALVDDEDYDFLMQWKWCLQVGRNDKYNYAICLINNTQKRMHRLILGVTDPNIFVDHINHNGLDNQRNNIRKCTNQENLRNRNPWGVSKYLGVGVVVHKRKHYTKKHGHREYINSYWVARIKICGKEKRLGYFKSEMEAAKQYDIAAQKHFGRFANLNFK